MPTTGTRVDDPAQARVGDTPTLDPRATLGLDPESGATPDGLAGGTPDSPDSPHASLRGKKPDGRDTHGTFGGTNDKEIPWLIRKLYDTGLGSRLSAIVEDAKLVQAEISVVLDATQLVLDVVGMIPAVGELADGINVVISLVRGDYAGAALSFAAMVPIVGIAPTVYKWTRKATKPADAALDAIKAAKKKGDKASKKPKKGSNNKKHNTKSGIKFEKPNPGDVPELPGTDDSMIILYHGYQGSPMKQFDLQESINNIRTATPDSGLYMTNEFPRAVGGYATGTTSHVGSHIARGELPRSVAQEFYRRGGPSGQDLEFFFPATGERAEAARAAVAQLNQSFQTLPRNEAIKLWNQMKF